MQPDHICDWIFLVFLYPVQHRTWNIESFYWSELIVIPRNPWAKMLPGIECAKKIQALWQTQVRYEMRILFVFLLSHWLAFNLIGLNQAFKVESTRRKEYRGNDFLTLVMSTQIFNSFFGVKQALHWLQSYFWVARIISFPPCFCNSCISSFSLGCHNQTFLVKTLAAHTNCFSLSNWIL